MSAWQRSYRAGEVCSRYNPEIVGKYSVPFWIHNTMLAE